MPDWVAGGGSWLTTNWTAVIATVALLISLWTRLEQWGEHRRKRSERDPRMRIGTLTTSSGRVTIQVGFENRDHDEVVVEQIMLLAPRSDEIAIPQRSSPDEKAFGPPRRTHKVTWIVPPATSDRSGVSGTDVQWLGAGSDAYKAGGGTVVVELTLKGKFRMRSSKRRVIHLIANKTIKA